MKKGFITFCAFVLLATQAPAANAAATNMGEVSGNSHKSLIKYVQTYHYQTTIFNNKFTGWHAYTKFMKKVKTNSFVNEVQTNKFIKVPVKKTEEAPIIVKEEQTKVPVKQEVTEEQTKAPVQQEVTKEQTKAPVQQEVTEEQTKAPVKQEVTEEQTKAPVQQEVTEEQTKAPVKQEVTEEQTKAPVQQEVSKEEPKTTAPTNTQTAPKQATPVTSTSSEIDAIEAAVVELTNVERTKAGLQPLQIHKPLMAAAREKSQDMKNNNYFSHTSPTFGSPFDRLKALGISYRSAGENIAKGQRSAQEVVTAWMNSAGHRANILNPDFTHIGVGYVKDGHIWTQQFIKQ